MLCLHTNQTLLTKRKSFDFFKKIIIYFFKSLKLKLSHGELTNRATSDISIIMGTWRNAWSQKKKTTGMQFFKNLLLTGLQFGDFWFN